MSTIQGQPTALRLREIKHDGFRLMVRREGSRVAAIFEAARRLRAHSFPIDGEAVVSRPDGLSDFDALRFGRRAHKVTLAAFDLIELQGEDLRDRPLEKRKQRLAKMLARGGVAITYNDT